MNNFKPESHAYNADVASQFGLIPAIIYNHVHFWIKVNETGKRNFHDGRYWMFQSIPDMAKHFNYLSEKQIRDALKKLVTCGLLVKGNYNKHGYDKTAWYALETAETLIRPTGRMDATSASDGCDDEGAPIPDNNKDNKKDNNSAGEDFWVDYSENNLPPDPTDQWDAEAFERWWRAYPRLVNKKKAKIAYMAAMKKADCATLLRGAEEYARQNRDTSEQYIKKPENWLAEEMWDEYQPKVKRYLVGGQVREMSEELAKEIGAVEIGSDKWKSQS